MKNRICFLIGSIFLGSTPIMLSNFAMAQQSPGSPGAPPPRQERPDYRSPVAQAAENYDAKGVAVGSFKLYPELELDEVYNDNVFATSFGTAGRTASFVQLIKPSLNLRSNWNDHMLNFFAKGNIGLFAATTTPNFTDYSFGTDGRFDIQRDWNVYGGASFNHSHEDPGTPNAAIGAVAPNFFDQIAGNLGYFQKFNRLSLRADGRIDNYNYLNNSVGVNSAVASSDRNRNEYRESLRVGYEVFGDSQAWVRGSLNQRRYRNTPDSGGLFRDSSGFDVVAGVLIDFGGITSVEVFGGYLQQDYVDGNFRQVAQPTFGLTGFWNPLREISVRPFIQRTVNEAGFSNATAYLSTSGGLDVDYKVRPNIKLSAHGDYSIADYSIISRTTNEYDQYLTLRASALYSPDNIFFVGPSYQYVYKTSNQLNANYDQSVVMLRFGAHL
jgi:hypothetical protein